METPKLNTFIVPVIRPDLIDRMLETLYRHTPDNFYVYIIDQTVKGLDSTRLRNTYKNLMVIRTPKTDVHYTGNLGFAQATNLGIQLVQTPYFTMCNDDVEFLNKKWWSGVIETFDVVSRATPDRPAVIVNPSSFKLPDWSVGRPKGDDFYIIPYKRDYTEAEYDHLINDDHYINEHLTLKPGSVIDGVTLYCSVADTRKFLEVGMLDEKYFPGSGEDYDFSCTASMKGYRCVGTTMSYIFHHWSATFQALQDEDEVKSLQIPELNWNHNHEKWGEGFDIWGVKCINCGANMRCLEDNKLVAVCSKHLDTRYTLPDSLTQAL